MIMEDEAHAALLLQRPRQPARGFGHVAPGDVEMAVVAIIRIGDRLPFAARRHGRAAATAAPGFRPAASRSRSARFSASSATIWSNRSKSPRVTWRARRWEMSTPLRRAAAIARRSGGSPACQSPVPAESTSTSSPSRSGLGAERRLGERRAADIAEADEQDPSRSSHQALLPKRPALLARSKQKHNRGDVMAAHRGGGRARGRRPSRASAPMPGTPCSSWCWSTSSISSTGRSSRSWSATSSATSTSTDAQIGFLYGTAFAVFYALFGIPLGRLADSWYRGRLMAMGLALWSSMTALSGFANSFGMLAAARIGVGIGEASASPAAYSMISD